MTQNLAAQRTRSLFPHEPLQLFEGRHDELNSSPVKVALSNRENPSPSFSQSYHLILRFREYRMFRLRTQKKTKFFKLLTFSIVFSKTIKTS